MLDQLQALHPKIMDLHQQQSPWHSHDGATIMVVIRGVVRGEARSLKVSIHQICAGHLLDQ